MKTTVNNIALIISVILINTNITKAQEFSGSISGDLWMFLNSPLYPGQKYNNFSIGIELELYKEFENGSSYIFIPFGRFDAADPKRTHFDIRELNYLWVADSWELRVGLSKVFWGSVEFVHLIDIINQTDAVESIDYEEKLGQPIVHLSLPCDWGILDFFILPYFIICF